MKTIKAIEIRKILPNLLSTKNYPSITIYIEAFAGWRENEKARIELKNQISSVTEQLASSPLSAMDAQAYISKLEDVVKSHSVWQADLGGLALLLSEETQFLIQLPDKVPSRYYVANFFNLKFLTRYLFEIPNFYVLAISANKSSIFLGEKDHYTKLDISSELPQDMADAPGIDEGEKSVQNHTTRAIGPGKNGGMMFHGHGGFAEGKEILMKRYMKRIDNVVHAFLAKMPKTLITICSDAVLARLKEVAAQPELYALHISGNPDAANDFDSLFGETQALIHRKIKKEKKSVLDKFNNTMENKVTRIAEAVNAAHFGKIEVLLLSNFDDYWGNYDFKNSAVKHLSTRTYNTIDLLGLCILLTLKNRGIVQEMSEFDSLKGYETAGILHY